MSDSANPRVFLSYATEDKDRFVLSFATKLRAQGVDVWLDRWEIKAGDSLVAKIFEEGLKSAIAMIVVLSPVSVTKKWVRDELDVGVVNRISKGTRLIPVILDDASVPESLKATRWVRISDLNDYERELAEIVAAIFNLDGRPALGPAPRYASAEFTLPGLRRQDIFVLKLFCEAAVKKDTGYGIDTDGVAAAAADGGLSREQFLESATILTESGYLEESQVVASESPYYNVTVYGLEKYVWAAIADYRDIYRAVASQIVNQQKRSNEEIMVALGRRDYLLVDHILDVLDNNRAIIITKTVGHHTYINSFSPRLKRMLEEP